MTSTPSLDDYTGQQDDQSDSLLSMRDMSERIRIVYIVSSLQNCGPTTQLYNLISHLNPKYFQINWFSPIMESSQLYKGRLKNQGDRDHFGQISVISLSLFHITNYTNT